MNKLGLALLIGLALVMAAVFLLPVIGFIFLPMIMERMGATPEPRGDVLIYEVDPERAPVGICRLTSTVKRRLNSEGKQLAHVRLMGDWQIEVAMLRRNDAEKQRVKQLLSQTGTLEFRILANNRDNKDVIERALAKPSEMQILDANGKMPAWWVPVKAGEEKSFEYGDIVRRTRKVADREVTEVLVLKDPYDMTGDYITRAWASLDRKENPCVDLEFNTIGGQLFGELTASHLPDSATNFTYRLGIILDGEMYSAPSIQSVFTDRCEITGVFTEREVEDLANVLNSGSLPARLRLVETRPSP